MLINDHDRWYENPDFWRIYEPLMFDPDRIEDTELEVEQMIRLSGIEPPADILDVCCGWGRHGFEFVKKGYTVTGVDITEPYLQQGREQAAKTGLKMKFIHQDVRDYKQENSYDLAVNFFSSFGYFDEPEDDLRFCENVCKSLRKNGIFLIDTIGKETAALKFKETEWFRRDGYLIMLEYEITDGWTHIRNRWRFLSDNPSEKNELYDAVFMHRLYSAVEMAKLLSEAGFTEIRFYGALDGRPYDHKAERMLCLAVK